MGWRSVTRVRRGDAGRAGRSRAAGRRPEAEGARRTPRGAPAPDAALQLGRSVGIQGALRAATSGLVQRQCQECEEEEENAAASQSGQAGVIQPKLEVGPVDDPFEREADQVAERVMRSVASAPPAGAPAVVRRAPASTAGAKGVPMQGGETALTAEQLSAGGAPLAGRVRSFFEGSFGRDLSGVRVHGGETAARYNDGLNARAFTHDRHIWLGRSERSEPSFVMAHEMAHVVQQTQPPTLDQGGARDALGRQRESALAVRRLAHVALRDGPGVRRQPYETRGIALDRTASASLAAESYWRRRTLTTYYTALHSRITGDPEERDAVLSALWGTNPPTTVTAASTFLLRVPARTIPATGTQTTPTQAPELFYNLTFSPPAAGDPRPVLDFEFVAAGAPVAAPAAPATFQPSAPAMGSQGFPGGHHTYFAAHPDEHRALFQWLETASPASFDHVLTTSTTPAGGGAATHQSVIHASGSRSGSTFTNLDLELLSESALGAAQTLPTDYRERDAVDTQLEALRDNPTVADRLGTVTLPTNIPADERPFVKFAVWQYFTPGARTEVDAIVPIGTGTRTALYTLVYGANNDVVVTRIGEAGTGAGQIDVERIDVNRVRGFPATSTTTAPLRTWWTSRYPRGGTLTPDPPAPAQGQPATPAPTTATLIAEMNQFIDNGVANRSWFDQNYGIEVLDASALATRLQSEHSVPGPSHPTSPDMTDDTVDLDATDLKMLELSLQTLSNDDLANLRGVKMGRKTSSIEPTSSGYQAGSATQYGLTLMNSSGSNREITVLFFQTLYDNNDRLFRGGTAAGALPTVSMRFLHELGHATGYSAGIEAAFNTWVAANPQTAPTRYAASNPADELFPEAFALYHTDPRFLCNSAPLLYSWFDALATSGSPPPATPALTAPGTCP